MKTSLSWLSSYVPVPDNHRDFTETLTLAGLEVEGIEVFGGVPDGVVVGEILAREPHPNADRLSVCRVDAGGPTPLQVVCGAPNCDAGYKVPVATVGTVLGEEFTIKKAKLRGVESRGMLCSADELGLGDDHSGLLILPEKAEIGSPVGNWVDRDVVVDWEVTPNRPDWLSHIGIAREAAAVYDVVDRFRLPQADGVPVAGTRTADAASVAVEAPDFCPRYIARVVRNVTVAPSPEWMQTRLRAVGLRPINNIVDITNYVLMECGQPLHAFDRDLLRDGAIIVRRAAAGETIVTLDQQCREMTAEDLLIADPGGGVAVAGIMGAGNSEIGDETTTVLLESAVFNPATVRATSRRLGLSTDSSQRFERGVGFEMAEYASRRAASLMCELAEGELLAEPIDVCGSDYEAHTVSCRVAQTNRLLGTDVSIDTMETYLGRLQLPVRRASADRLEVEVEVPSFRLDIDREADVIEEIARIHGLNNIPPTPVRASSGGSLRDDAFHPQERVREQLLSQGFDETMTYTYLSRERALRGTGVEPSSLLDLDNPLSADTATLRPSLIPGMVESLALNVARGNLTLRLFEIGRVFSVEPPEERWQAALLMTGRRHPERYGPERAEELDFFDLKGRLESCFEARRLSAAQTLPASHEAFSDGHGAEMRIDGVTVAVLGRLTDTLTADIRLRYPAYLALVELDALCKCASAPPLFTALPQYPATDRDISLIAPKSLDAGAVRDAIASMGIPTVESVALTDVYEDPDALGAGRRSLTFSITYRHPERTLQDQEVNEAQETIRTHLANALDIELR